VSVRFSFRAAAILSAACGLQPMLDGIASAQTNERLYENLDFRFVTPGARAVGMGKTFVGLGDDATAAVSNPAGLSNLLEQEFSLEFSGTQLRHRRTSPLGIGDTETFGDLVITPSFFSYVLPLRRATFSFFRNSVQDFEESFEFGPRLVPRREAPEDGAFGEVAIRAESYGFGGAFVVNRFLSVGGSASLMSMDFASEARSGTPLNPRNGTNTIESGLQWSGAVGVMVKPRRDLSIGGTYIKGTTFAMRTRLFGQFLFTVVDPNGSIILNGEERDIDYVIPSRYAVGSSWRVHDSLTVLFDVARIRYSQRITENFLVVDFIDPAAGLTSDNFFVNDVTELHAGVEYRWYGTPTMAFRAGVFSDPDHPLRFRSGGNNSAHPADALLDFRFNTIPNRDEVGLTAGWGTAIANRVQLDMAGSFSPDAIEVVASMVLRIR
jgi:long-subunit fatty acid transport protein